MRLLGLQGEISICSAQRDLIFLSLVGTSNNYQFVTPAQAGVH